MRRRSLRFRPGDVVVILVLVVLAVGLTVLTGSVPRGARAVVLVDGISKAVLPLDQPGEVRVNGALGETVVVVDSLGVQITESACPHKTCVHMGHISVRGQVLICVPNHVAVRVEGGDDESNLDGVTG